MSTQIITVSDSNECSRMENIFTTSKQFLLLMKVFGLFPLTVEGPIDKGNYKIKQCDRFICYCMLVLWFFVIAANFLYFELVESPSIVIRNTYNISLLIGVFSLLVMMCYQWWKCEAIVKLLKCIHNFDLKVIVN